VQRAVRELGGTVAVRNEDGAVFTVRLPHAKEPAAAR
jgi:signal transduction histidine kinase